MAGSARRRLAEARRRLAGVARGWPDRYAGRVARLRWLLAAGWVVAAALATFLLPQVSTSSGSDPTAALPAGSPALAAQLRSLKLFAIPNVSTTIVVIRDRAGLGPFVQADAVLWALSYDQRLARASPPYPRYQVLGALPLVNGLPLVPGRVTTAVTYLYFSASTGSATQTRLGRLYAAHFDGLAGVRSYVTGVAPATVATGDYLGAGLPRMTLATLIFVALIVGVTFRSVIAPAATLCAAGLAYLIDLRVLGAVAHAAGLSVSSERDPIIVALLLGITTDYTVLFLSSLRDRLAAGAGRETAIREAIGGNVPLVVLAGFMVAAGTAVLQISSSSLFRAFGPGLAITAVVGLTVAVTLIPALMALLGGAMFWPSSPGRLAGRAQKPAGRRTAWWVRAVTSRRPAALATAGCLVALVVACLPLGHARLGLSFVGALPAQAPARVGAQAAAAGYAAGITAPTEVLLQAPGIAARRVALAKLQQQVAKEPGIAGVLGAGDDPLQQAHGLLFSDSG
ncbi:MAG: MMPL family transporter [Streptosporangiaceae bacterium]